MHLRFSTALGLPVCEEGSQEPLGFLSAIVVHPDTGKVEGFLVTIGGFLWTQQRFLSTIDILRWSLRVVVSSPDVLCEPGDVVRLEPLFSVPRPILGQPIVTVGGKPLGRCADIQFDTVHFQLEWLFPRKWFRWRVPIPASQISEVRVDAIVVNDLKADMKVKAEGDLKPGMLPGVGEAGAA